VIPTAFDIKRPTSVDDAIEALVAGGEEARPLAGGHSLLPLMRLRLAVPSLLVDLSKVDGLSYIREDGDTIAIGALTRHVELERSDLLERRCRLLPETAALIGDPQVRNRGTIGGSLAHADPHGDLPATILALGAELVATGQDGTRTIPAGEFFVDYFTTALAHGELLTEIRVPALDDAGSAYEKFSRRAQDWAVVGCAAVVRDEPTVAWTGVGPTPISAGRDWRTASEALDPPADLSGSAEYKRHLAKVLAGRALARARS
jgi:aerobic carbon-monoxide dehydrogenase medium subunit